MPASLETVQQSWNPFLHRYLSQLCTHQLENPPTSVIHPLADESNHQQGRVNPKNARGMAQKVHLISIISLLSYESHGNSSRVGAGPSSPDLRSRRQDEPSSTIVQQQKPSSNPLSPRIRRHEGRPFHFHPKFDARRREDSTSTSVLSFSMPERGICPAPPSHHDFDAMRSVLQPRSLQIRRQKEGRPVSHPRSPQIRRQEEG